MRRHRHTVTGYGHAQRLEDGTLGSIWLSKCITCQAWLSLGPSNDEPPQVQIEMRAAEIAAEPGQQLTGPEIEGWHLYGGLMTVSGHVLFTTDGWLGEHGRWAGYLARCISTHGASDE